MSSDYHKLEVQEVDEKSEVPNNKRAKLLYYLKCVSKVIDSAIEERYTHFKAYILITYLEEQTILKLASTFNPTVMRNLNLFIIEPDFVSVGKENEFYDISDERFAGKIKSEVVIEEVPRKVLKVMVCKESWIKKYYEEPLKEYGNSSENYTKISENDISPDKKKCLNCDCICFNPDGCCCCNICCSCECCTPECWILFGIGIFCLIVIGLIIYGIVKGINDYFS